MSGIRAIIEGSIKDYEAFAELAKRACAFVEENERGILVYECFADQASGRFLWQETYRDDEAFLTHVRNMTETGIMGEAMAVADFDRTTILDPVTDPQAREVLEQMGAVQLNGLARVVR